MAQRRMFSKTITNSDKFLGMPLTAQCLYFHLGMNADDDGFVQLKSVMHTLGSTEDDARILFARDMLLQTDSGVVVITDWLVNNEIRKDRYKETFYIEERGMLEILPNRRYTIGCQMVVPNDNRLDTQVRLGKVRLGKVNTYTYALFLEDFNRIVGSRYRGDTKSKGMLKARLNEGFTKDDILTAVNNASKDSYLMGENDGCKRYLKPEYILRSNKLDEWLNHSKVVQKVNKKPVYGTWKTEKIVNKL